MIAKCNGQNSSVSFKQSIEIANAVRGKPLRNAYSLLETVLDMKVAIPFRRYTDGVGHRKGMGSGRYPLKTSAEFVRLLKSAESNAKNLGMDHNKLVIKTVVINKAAQQMHQGRNYGRKMKRCHIYIELEETDKILDKTLDNKTQNKKTVTKSPKVTTQEKTNEMKTKVQVPIETPEVKND